MPDSCSSILIVWAKYLSASERYHLVLLENTIDYLVLSSHQPLEMQEFGIFCWLSSFSDISILNISQMVTPKPINHTILWKSLTRSFSCSKYFAQTVTNFLLSSAENTKKKWVICDIGSTIYSLSSNRWYISFPYFNICKIQFIGVFAFHYVLVCKMHVYMPKVTLPRLLT